MCMCVGTSALDRLISSVSFSTWSSDSNSARLGSSVSAPTDLEPSPHIQVAGIFKRQ